MGLKDMDENRESQDRAILFLFVLYGRSPHISFVKMVLLLIRKETKRKKSDHHWV
jgi:hypothetical protein